MDPLSGQAVGYLNYISKINRPTYKHWLAEVSLSPNKRLDLIRLSHGPET